MVDPSVIVDATKYVIDKGIELTKYLVGAQGKFEIHGVKFTLDREEIQNRIVSAAEGEDESELKILYNDLSMQFAIMKKSGAAVSLGRRLSGSVPEYATTTKESLAANKTYKQFRFVYPIQVDWTVAHHPGTNVSWIDRLSIEKGSAVTPHNNWNEPADLSFGEVKVTPKPDGEIGTLNWNLAWPGRGAAFSAGERVGKLLFQVGGGVDSSGAGAECFKQM